MKIRVLACVALLFALLAGPVLAETYVSVQMNNGSVVTMRLGHAEHIQALGEGVILPDTEYSTSSTYTEYYTMPSTNTYYYTYPTSGYYDAWGNWHPTTYGHSYYYYHRTI